MQNFFKPDRHKEKEMKPRLGQRTVTADEVLLAEEWAFAYEGESETE